ncbi:hypothetical protein BDV06DRAFT_217550 [Aspergillus oleicola]
MALPVSLSYEDYTLGWVCALPIELSAAALMLDAVHLNLPHRHDNDRNTYKLGSIARHNVVVTCLPSGVYGTTKAALVSQEMTRTFLNLKCLLMVGVGGGAPGSSRDIRLGDIVVSKPTNSHGGVVQYDFGKAVAGGQFSRTGVLNKPAQILLSAIAQLKASHNVRKLEFASYVAEVTDRQSEDSGARFRYPGKDQDYLFESSYNHAVSDATTCSNCDNKNLIERAPRPDTTPHVHYGLIASGNTVMKMAFAGTVYRKRWMYYASRWRLRV